MVKTKKSQDLQSIVVNLFKEDAFKSLANIYSVNSKNFYKRLLILKKNKKERMFAKASVKYMLRMYINTLRFRIDELVTSMLYSYSEKKFLQMAITARHLYETIAHNYYLLNHKLGSAMTKSDIKIYKVYLKKLFILKDINEVNESPILYNKKMESSFSDNLLHINDSLRYYKKFIRKSWGREAEIDCNSAYNHLSQISHPNPMGTYFFYTDDRKDEFETFSEIGKEKHNLMLSIFIVVQHIFFYIENLELFASEHEIFYKKNNDKYISASLKTS